MHNYITKAATIFLTIILRTLLLFSVLLVISMVSGMGFWDFLALIHI